MQSIENTISQTVQELYDQQIIVELTRTDPEFGDYATNVALQMAGKLSKSPRDVAEAIAEQLRGHEMLDEVSIAGPGFINIRVASTQLAINLARAITDAPGNVYGASTIGAKKTVICEFPSPNMAKPFSVGHIRSALQGWAMYKLMELMGYAVVTDNHLGDVGTPFGKWVAGFLRYSNEEALERDGIHELARVYIQITNDIKTETEQGGHALADEVQDWLKRLESNNEEAVRYSAKFNRISIDHMHSVMTRLGIRTEYELGESFYVARGQQLVDELLQKNIAVESEGAVVVHLDEQGINSPIMLRKANGTALYATTDLATIEYRQKQWHPVKVFIHTGQEQAFYFRQLKALACKAGYEDTIQHLWHGLVDQKSEDGSREKMSSRKGVILLDTLLDEAEKRTKAYIKQQGSPEDLRTIALGAIKFADFSADRKNGVLFDWETILSVQGFSGPAVQYAAVRIGSILAKTTDTTESLVDGYDWQSEHELLLRLHEFPALLLTIHKDYETHKLATYLYALARELNRYYEQTQILKAEEPARTNRLWLLRQVKSVFSTGLSILGISIPEKM